MSANSETVNRTLTRRYTAHAHRVFAVVMAVAWVALVAWGWSIRDEDYISPSSGLGYLLGITGGSMVLLLLTYSVRKRVKFLRNLLHLKIWFRVHMTLGVLAPTAILFHSGFSFGAPNSTVALICLLTVAASGLVGRFLYNRVHAGVHGEKLKLVQVRKDFNTLREALLELAVTPKQKQRTEKIFEALEELMVAQKAATLRTLWISRRRAHSIAESLTDLIQAIEHYHEQHPEAHAHQELAQARREIHNCADVLLAILKKLPGLHLFERLFSLWHVVHLPIFGLMVVTVITHVISVHMY